MWPYISILIQRSGVVLKSSGCPHFSLIGMFVWFWFMPNRFFLEEKQPQARVQVCIKRNSTPNERVGVWTKDQFARDLHITYTVGKDYLFIYLFWSRKNRLHVIWSNFRTTYIGDVGTSVPTALPYRSSSVELENFVM